MHENPCVLLVTLSVPSQFGVLFVFLFFFLFFYSGQLIELFFFFCRTKKKKIENEARYEIYLSVSLGRFP